MKIDFYRHGLFPKDADSITTVLSSPILTSGSVGKKVEAQLCEFFGTSDALLVNSWTNGALAVLIALGIRPGDEVIVPAMTFIATANVVELVGAKPVFVDVDPDTLLVTPKAIAAALTPRTRAVIPVHLYGQMCDIVGIREILSNRSDVCIIEDAAHCFEGARDGYVPGTHSDIAIFSFYATKNVTCGEGGAIVTNRPELAETVRKTRLHGMSAGAADRFKRGTYCHWDMETLGVKANLPDLLAALLPNQIAMIRERLPQRQALANYYRNAFRGTGIRMAAIQPGVISAEHLFPIHVPGAVRDSAIAALNARGISVAVNYRSVPTLTYYHRKYGYTPSDFPVSYAWGTGTITLPLFPGLRREEQDAVIEAGLTDVVPLCQRAA
jgi:dTDP-4-amino-4,6-dideoxygalactose transaminase